MNRPKFSPKALKTNEENVTLSDAGIEENNTSAATIRDEDLTHTLIGASFYDPELRTWVVCEVRYNPMTNQFGNVVKHPSGGSRDFAIEKFKILAAEHDLVG